MKRIHSIDTVRGLVMIVMALDHVRDLFHAPSLSSSPTDLATTSAPIFLTRFATHFCAPIFVFLAGTSAFLSLQKSANASASRNFLIKRGLWLILLELTVVNFGVWFDIGFHTFLFQVIGAIGFGFIFLGLCLNASPKTIGCIGIGLLFVQTVLPLLPIPEGAAKTVVFALFFPTAFQLGSHFIVYAYPIFSWTAVLFMGFGVGRMFASDYQSRLLGLSSLLIAMFVLLRFFNVGDVALWSQQKDVVFTVLSFINVTKYPPTLLFCTLTLGVMFVLLWLAEKTNNRLTLLLQTYGKVPLFYYLIHWYTIHLALVALLFWQGFDLSQLDFSAMRFGRPEQLPSGVALAWVYAVWIAVVVVLYLPVRWYAKYKAAHAQGWLRYL